MFKNINFYVWFTVTKENLNAEMLKLAKFIARGEIQQCKFKTAQQIIHVFEQLKKESFHVFGGV